MIGVIGFYLAGPSILGNDISGGMVSILSTLGRKLIMVVPGFLEEGINFLRCSAFKGFPFLGPSFPPFFPFLRGLNSFPNCAFSPLKEFGPRGLGSSYHNVGAFLLLQGLTPFPV